MTYDFKKEQSELYRPGKRPTVIKVPPMQFKGKVIQTPKMVNTVKHCNSSMELPTQLR